MPISEPSLGARLIADAIRERNEDLIGGLSEILAPRIDALAAERDEVAARLEADNERLRKA